MLVFVSSKLFEFALEISNVYVFADATAVQLNVGVVTIFVALFAGLIRVGAKSGPVVNVQVCDHVLDVTELLACTCQ